MCAFRRNDRVCVSSSDLYVPHSFTPVKGLPDMSYADGYAAAVGFAPRRSLQGESHGLRGWIRTAGTEAQCGGLPEDGAQVRQDMARARCAGVSRMYRGRREVRQVHIVSA